MRFFLCGAFVLAAAIAQPTYAAEEPDTATVMEAAKRAWRHREAAVRSARFTWTEQQFRPRAARLLGSPFSEPLEIDPATVTDLATVAHLSLAFEADKIKFTYSGRQPLEEGGAVTEKIGFTIGFNRELHWSLNSPLSFCEHFNGYIGQGSGSEHENVSLKPFWFAYRVLGVVLNEAQAERLQLAPQRGVVNGRNCLVLVDEVGEPRASSYVSLWVDAERDYSVVRYSSTDRASGVVGRQIDVTYEQDAVAGWVPMAWTILAQGPQGPNPQTLITGTVEKFEINPEIPAEEFEPAFPPGAVVDDEIAGTRYILREDGGKRIVTDEELVRGATYDQLLASESGEAFGKPERNYLGWVIALAVAAALALLAWRRRRIAPRAK